MQRLCDCGRVMLLWLSKGNIDSRDPLFYLSLTLRIQFAVTADFKTYPCNTVVMVITAGSDWSILFGTPATSHVLSV